MKDKVETNCEKKSEWHARKRESERIAAIVEEFRVRLRVDEAPLVKALADSGYPVESVWSLVNSRGPYKGAIPILLEHLSKPHLDRTREGIARALAVPDARYAWPQLVEFYRSEPALKACGEKSDAKDGLAVAVAATVTDATLGELITLAEDKSQGSSRILLLRGLRKSKQFVAKQAIEKLASDPELEREISSWKRRK